jgi:hypothetical protein
MPATLIPEKDGIKCHRRNGDYVCIGGCTSYGGEVVITGARKGYNVTLARDRSLEGGDNRTLPVCFDVSHKFLEGRGIRLKAEYSAFTPDSRCGNSVHSPRLAPTSTNVSSCRNRRRYSNSHSLTSSQTMRSYGIPMTTSTVDLSGSRATSSRVGPAYAPSA